jgi:hypothetical protein
VRSGGKPRRRPAGGTVQTPPNLEPVAADDQSGTQLPLAPLEEPAEILVRFSTDEPDAAAEPVAKPPAPDEAAVEPVAKPPAPDEAAVEQVAKLPATEEAAVEQVVKPPADSFAAPVAGQPLEATVAASFEVPSAYEPDEPGPVEDASLLLRIARIHLRTGSLTTARAQLESLAGRNQLDTAGTLDLAEARWRTGDLPGAGDAAGAYLAANGGEALGLVIAAEAASLGIHEAEARGYMEQARLRTLTSFDAIFSGIPRRSKLTESERERTSPEQIPVTESPKAAETAVQPVATVAAETAATVGEPQPKVEAEPVATVAAATVAEPQPKVEAEPAATVAVEPAAEPQPKVEAEPVATVAAETVAAEPVAAETVAAATVGEPQPKVEAEPVATVAAETAAAATEGEPQPKFEAEPAAMVAVEPVAAEPAAEPELIGAAAETEPEPTPTVPVASVVGTPATGPSIADQAAQPAVDSSRAQADTEIAAGIALLETGDALLAALHFGIALRMTPESAQAVLRAIGDRHDLALELVRGDALRMQGHEQDAGQAYQSVASALSGARAAVRPPAEAPAGPADAVAGTPAEAVAELPAEPPGPLPVDAGADVPAAIKSTEAAPEAERLEPRPPEPAPPISWLD